MPWEGGWFHGQPACLPLDSWIGLCIKKYFSISDEELQVRMWFWKFTNQVNQAAGDCHRVVDLG